MAKLTKAISALVLGVTVAGTAVTPAEAQRWRGGRGDYYRGGRGVSPGAAVGIGILGLGVGAALASRPRYYDRGGWGRGWDRGGWDRGYYGGRGYGGGGFYGRPAYGYGYGQRCVTRRVYDPYIGRRVRIRDCW